MDNQKIKQLVGSFLHNDISEGLQHRFHQWMLQPSDREQKDEALRQEWDSILNTTTAQDRSRELQQLHRTIRRNEAVKRREGIFRRMRIAAAAAAVLLLMAGEYYLVSASKSTPPEIRLLTAANSKGEFRLPDGTRVWLNASSRLTYPETFDRKARRVTLEGEAYFEVKHDASHPFVVSMNRMQVEVLGTTFDARYDRTTGLAEATLSSGSIRVTTDRSRQPVLLSPDERLVFDEKTGSMTIGRVNADNYKSWTYPSLTFFDMPLGDIVTNLERWYNTSIRTDAELDPDIRLSFHVRYESLEETLQVISLILPIRYTLDDGVITLYKAHTTQPK